LRQIFGATLGDCAIMDKEQRIRELAYHLWIEDGRPHGRQDEHWERALSQVAGDAAGERGAPKRRVRKAAKPGLAKPEPAKARLAEARLAKQRLAKPISGAKRASSARTRGRPEVSS